MGTGRLAGQARARGGGAARDHKPDQRLSNIIWADCDAQTCQMHSPALSWLPTSPRINSGTSRKYL